MIEELLADITDCEKQAVELVAQAKVRAAETLRLAKEEAARLFQEQKRAAAAQARQLLEQTEAKAAGGRKERQAGFGKKLKALAEASQTNLDRAGQFILEQAEKRYGPSAD